MPDVPPTLLEKLLKITKAIDLIEKRGYNTFQNYKFVQATDVVREIRKQLIKNRVSLVPGATGVEHLPYQAAKGGAAFLTTLTLHYRFTDLDTSEIVEIPWVGVGADTGGDKGVYKAFTGGLKYMLLATFLIPTEEDPERDHGDVEPDVTAPTLPSGTTAPETHPDDARPAAPRIPVDRAKAILALALRVGMASLDPEAAPGTPPVFHAVFKAKLAMVGAEKVGLLSVDQAEDIEQFLNEEAVPE